MHRTLLAATALFTALAFSTPRDAQATPERYVLDKEHFTVAFLVDHIGFQRQLGQFLDASGEFVWDDETETLSDLKVEVQAASVFSNHDARDAHTRNADFLHADQHPVITFVGTDAEKTGDNTGVITGDLTLLGTSRPVTVEVTRNREGVYPFGHRRHTIGISARATINRSDWGMIYAVDNGLVGDEVELIFEVEAIQAEPADG